jgi:xanthosine utilization system XapX-like protein
MAMIAAALTLNVVMIIIALSDPSSPAPSGIADVGRARKWLVGERCVRWKKSAPK